MAVLDIGVIGAGTAGAAAAIFLARAGHEVTVYERVPDPKPIGAGIVVQPTGLTVLARLGVAAEIIRRGAPIKRLRCTTSTGKTVVDLDYATVLPGWHGLGLHRGVLFQELHRALKNEPRIKLVCGFAAEDLASVRGRGGAKWIVDTDGKRHGPHDLIIVADGARSHLRDDTSVTKSVRPYTWGAMWHVAEDRERSFANDELYQVVEGSKRMLGLLPTGLGPDADATEPLVSVFWSIRGDLVDAWREDGLDAWRKEVARLVPHARPLLDDLDDAHAITFASYHDVVMDRWHTRSVVYIGDAAHAMSPQLGQGCNLALYDAMVLADCIAATPHLPVALDLYSRARREHLDFYQLATRWLTPFFQSDVGVLAGLRDWFMGPFSRIPFVRREMVRSMTGTKTGIFAGALEVEHASLLTDHA
jgi:2-polyprenyl-6-methoxyphenol hydroxylase-like FAD-dependent oxidoreductase